MPRALEPGQTFKVVLDSDKDKPPESQPYFVCRSVSGRKWREAAKAHEEFEETKGATERFDKMYALIGMFLVGWKNMVAPEDIPGVCAMGGHVPFDTKNLDLLVDPFEAGELLEKALHGQQVTEDDKKKFDSPA